MHKCSQFLKAKYVLKLLSKHKCMEWKSTTQDEWGPRLHKSNSTWQTTGDAQSQTLVSAQKHKTLKSRRKRHKPQTS